jgi:hypothetical protein
MAEKCQEETFNTLREPLSHSRASRKFQRDKRRNAASAHRNVMREASDADLDGKLAGGAARAE